MINRILTKKDVSNIIDQFIGFVDKKETVLFADHIMKIGFKYAAIAGISFGKDDLIIPSDKNDAFKHYSKKFKNMKTNIKMD